MNYALYYLSDAMKEVETASEALLQQCERLVGQQVSQPTKNVNAVGITALKWVALLSIQPGSALCDNVDGEGEERRFAWQPKPDFNKRTSGCSFCGSLLPLLLTKQPQWVL